MLNFFRYLLRQTIQSQIAVFLYSWIFITLKFARILGDASDGDVPADLVLGFSYTL